MKTQKVRKGTLAAFLLIALAGPIAFGAVPDPSPKNAEYLITTGGFASTPVIAESEDEDRYGGTIMTAFCPLSDAVFYTGRLALTTGTVWYPELVALRSSGGSGIGLLPQGKTQYLKPKKTLVAYKTSFTRRPVLLKC